MSVKTIDFNRAFDKVQYDKEDKQLFIHNKWFKLENYFNIYFKNPVVISKYLENTKIKYIDENDKEQIMNFKRIQAHPILNELYYTTDTSKEEQEKVEIQRKKQNEQNKKYREKKLKEGKYSIKDDVSRFIKNSEYGKKKYFCPLCKTSVEIVSELGHGKSNFIIHLNTKKHLDNENKHLENEQKGEAGGIERLYKRIKNKQKKILK